MLGGQRQGGDSTRSRRGDTGRLLGVTVERRVLGPGRGQAAVRGWRTGPEREAQPPQTGNQGQQAGEKRRVLVPDTLAGRWPQDLRGAVQPGAGRAVCWPDPRRAPSAQ